MLNEWNCSVITPYAATTVFEPKLPMVKLFWFLNGIEITRIDIDLTDLWVNMGNCTAYLLKYPLCWFCDWRVEDNRYIKIWAAYDRRSSWDASVQINPINLIWELLSQLLHHAIDDRFKLRLNLINRIIIANKSMLIKAITFLFYSDLPRSLICRCSKSHYLNDKTTHDINVPSFRCLPQKNLASLAKVK